ncbi:MAG: hypothetical protein HZB57_05645, partial [Gammaproteobacteria bacterium]|nr:hypothetical protein [Gammaproteobacteria bacterium]
MRTFLRIQLVMLVMLVFGVSVVSAEAGSYGPNLIPNPSFELTENDGPLAWGAFGLKGCCKWINGEGLGGSGSLLITAETVASPVWESEYIPLGGAGGGAEFSAWMKMENVLLGAQLWHKAGIRLTFFDAGRRVIKRLDVVRDEGTSGWAQIRNAVIIPEKAASVKVACYLSNTTGKVLFDDISLRLFPEHVGKRPSDTGGEDEITITVDPSISKGDIGNVNGLLYENARKKFSGVKGLQPTIIRTPQIVTYYYLIKDIGKGKIGYEWSLLDRDIREIVGMGAVPFISIGWVPEVLEEEIRNKDYSRWRAFIIALVSRYSGKYDVSGWYWNFWNEPDVFRKVGGKKGYVNWTGAEIDFYQFYAETARAALAANKNVRIGGAGFAANSPWLFRFIEWCGVSGVRLGFVSWHSYGAVPQLLGEKIERVRAALGKYGSTKNAGLVIDEWSSYLEVEDESKVELSMGNYAAAYRVSALTQMIESRLSANAWFNTYEDDYGVLAGGVKQATYNSFVLVSEVGRKLVAV